MCRAFSCIVDVIGKVTWKLGVDSHGELARIGGYPLVDLWRLGLVPSFDGKTWCLHGGPKAEILYSISAVDLRKGKLLDVDNKA